MTCRVFFYSALAAINLLRDGRFVFSFSSAGAKHLPSVREEEEEEFRAAALLYNKTLFFAAAPLFEFYCNNCFFSPARSLF